jgi:sensor histidine kinase YesM
VFICSIKRNKYENKYWGAAHHQRGTKGLTPQFEINTTIFDTLGLNFFRRSMRVSMALVLMSVSMPVILMCVSMAMIIMYVSMAVVMSVVSVVVTMMIVRIYSWTTFIGFP